MTAQISERLILNGKERGLSVCPRLPPDPALLLPVRVEHFEDKLSERETYYRVMEYWIGRDGVSHCEEGCSMTYSTACWREYTGTWELKDGHFYLVAISGRYRLAVPGPLFADWFTGVLRLKYGQQICYVHIGFGTVTEKELHIKIVAGREVARRTIDNRGKHHDWAKLGWANLPGSESRFPGDDELMSSKD